MKKLPIGIQTFSEIRENNYAYVDKTGIAVDLIERYIIVVAFFSLIELSDVQGWRSSFQDL